MNHGGSLKLLMLSIILGIACGDPRKLRTIIRPGEKTSRSQDTFERNIKALMENIRSLSKVEQGEKASKNIQQSMSRMSAPLERIAIDSTNLDTYLTIFNSLFSVYQPTLIDSFIETLPQALICVLADRQHCGWQGDLTSIVSSALNDQVLSVISSVKTEACMSTSNLRTADSTMTQFNSFQEMLTNVLSSDLPFYLLSDNVLALWNRFMDMTIPPVMSFMSDFMLNALQTPVDFLNLGLQFGIEIPTIDRSEQCQQGDLKQLIMWGMNNNVSWSFGQSLLDMFLAPEIPPCSFTGPECQVTGSIQYSRTGTNIPTYSLTCEQQNLNQLNKTLCAAILEATSQESYVLYQMCRALSTLSQTELTKVWRNACHMIKNASLPLIEPCSDPGSAQSSRIARSTLSLNELLCDYQNWTVTNTVDPALVTMCSENDPEAFILAVCNNAETLQVLVRNPSNTWVWEFCANVSDTYIVNLYCSYNMWTAETIDSSIVTFCWYNDMEKFQFFLCDSMPFFMIVFSNEENNWLKPNCSQPSSQIDINALVAESCRYSEWNNAQAVTPEQISVCIQNDEVRFINVVCVNHTFVTELVLNSINAWVEQYCTYSVRNPPTSPPPLSIEVWCNYSTWKNMSVDPSVVALCWQYDQIGFHQNVCCNIPLFNMLSLHVDNYWMIRECYDNSTTNIVGQVCVYSDWNQPTIVDMTDLALCADLDTENFTRNVCANVTVLQNLLANLDNTWLLEQCANLTAPGSGGGTGNGGSLMGFRPAKQCQYSSWALVLPDAALLALCWDYDHANFISFICADSSMVTHITREPSNLWVGTVCAKYTASQSTGASGSNETAPQLCLTRELANRLNWTCSTDFSAVCQPGVSQVQGLLLLLRCGIKIIQPRLENLMTAQVASVVKRATNLWVVLLLALEESQMTSLMVTENIRLSVLDSIFTYMDNESNFDNKRVLLQCFGKVLTSLMQTGRDVPTNFYLVKEYFRIPLSYLRSVLSAADSITMREILLYYNRNYATLQLTDDYLHTMVSVLFKVQLPRDITLFPDMGLLLTLATPSEILSMPPLQNNINALSIINFSIKNLSLEQQQAFGRWFSRSMGLPNMTAGSLSFIRDTGNLIAYLPFQSFQYLSPAQLLDGLDVLMSNPLDLLEQQFIAESLFGTFGNLTVSQIRRLGNLSCLAHPSQLMTYAGTEAFSVIQDNIRMCVAKGFNVPSNMIFSLVLRSSDLQAPSNLTSQRISELGPFLPMLGTSVLQQLSSAQLMAALSTLTSVPFTPAQASVIIDKISANFSLALPGSEHLSMLGSLVSGVKVETLWTLSTDVLLEALPAISLQTPGLTPPQVNIIISKLWGSSSVSQWMDKVEPLLSSTPLLSVILQVSLLLIRDTAVHTRLWNTQQAKVLFKEAVISHPSLSLQDFLSLGTLATGVNCPNLVKLFQNLASVSPLRDILTFLKEQPVPLHPSLKKCIIEELYEFDFFPDLLGDLGSQIALSLPLSTIKKFPQDKMDSLRKMIVQDPYYFLLLPSTKQAVLVDKMFQRLNMYTGLYTEEEFRSLGVMATFVTDEMFWKLDRSFFVDGLEFLQRFCYNANKRDMVADMLQEQGTFGPVKNWTSETLNQVDRFLFFLPKSTIQLIPLGLMSLERIERLFLSQQMWESGEFGSLCQKPSELFDKKQFVLQFFLGFLKMGRAPYTGLIPSCESLHLTQPAAWTIDSLRNMPQAAFRRCLELIGQDPFFSAFELLMLLTKTKEVYGNPSSFNSSVISQLGRIATQLSLEELASLRLSEIQSISAMGSLNTWTSRQLKALFSTVLNSTRKTPSQLDSSTFVALGYIVCGIDAPVMRTINPVEFSKAVLWLGGLNLSCSEEQLQSLIGLLSNSLAFGPVSSWGSEVFIEIGVIAAGLPDIAMSALVKEQIEGITPLAISLIPASKFAVVFNQAQIRMFTYDQAVALTEAQRSALSPVQQTALSMVLNPWEDKPVDFRGMSLGVALHPCPFFYLSSILIMLLFSLG
ncbi:stereocilin isoform X2 [Puntigrus tetrazona]|uniref:stereocilin isoform X2 n=1 Tax=Puntigrus tetrazona TaxID=1606681 RepID=UPI001C8A66E7|nr:stereocilin isoform X2 [Puntigrus tetrazona]